MILFENYVLFFLLVTTPPFFAFNNVIFIIKHKELIVLIDLEVANVLSVSALCSLSAKIIYEKFI